MTAFVSICTGTSWGSAGTVGVAIMGVAAGMGAPLPIVAGAVVSGAYFGDKLSPLSDTTNLAPIAAGSKLYDHIGHMLWTTGPGAILCIIVYTVAGFNLDTASYGTPEKVEAVLFSLESIFNFNIFLLLPVVLVLFGSITKKPTIPVMLLSSAIALFNGVAFEGFTLQQGFSAAIEDLIFRWLTLKGLTQQH